MLSTEFAVQVHGFTLFRDHADKRKYYYLPKGDVHIADKGKKLNYFAYVDSTMGSKIEEKGGFLTLEVDLGPTQDELDDLKQHFGDAIKAAKNAAMAEKRMYGEEVDESEWDDDLSANDYVLAPVQFKDGDVKLVVMGEEMKKAGATSENTSTFAPLIEIVGTQKPSLFGKQTAVFSVQLKGMAADIMYQLLNVSQVDPEKKAGDPEPRYINSQMAVMYDLKYKGIEPAHFVKITVDFKAVEHYWNHHFNLDADFGYGDDSKKKNDTNKSNIAIAADVDVDAMLQDLINEGSIVVQQIDYTGSNEGSPLSADDPTSLNLVKRLMSDEIFSPTLLPKSADWNNKQQSEDKDQQQKSTTENKEQQQKSTTENKEQQQKATTANKEQQKATATNTEQQQKATAANTEQQKPAAANTEQEKPATESKEQEKSEEKAGGETETKKTEEKTTVAKAVKPEITAVPQTEKKDKKIEFPTFLSVAGVDRIIDLDEWLKKGFSEEDFNKYAFRKYYMTEANYKEYYTERRKKDKHFSTQFSKVAGVDKILTEEEWKCIKGTTDEDWEKFTTKEIYIDEERYNKYKEDTLKQQVTQCGGDQPEKESLGEAIAEAALEVSTIGAKIAKGLDTAKTVADTVGGVLNTLSGQNCSVQAIEWKLDVNIGYTYKQRDTSELVKRTYIFNKQTAVDQIIHPCGMLTVDGKDSEFDVTKQVMVGRLGDGPFREHTIHFESALNFEKYNLKKILIDVNHIGSTGTVVELTPEKTGEDIHFVSEKFKAGDVDGDKEAYERGENLSYQVSLVFNPLMVHGYENQDKVLFVNEKKYTSKKSITIGPDDIENVHPLKIQAGNLAIGLMIKSASLALIQTSDVAGGEEYSIYNQRLLNDTDQIILLNPDNDYKARIQYNLEDPCGDIPVSKRELSYTTSILKSPELIIENPNHGMIKFFTADGVDSFENVRNIVVKLKEESGEEVSFTLSKNNPEFYYITDYIEGATPEKITVESIKANLRDFSTKEIEPPIKEITTATTSYEI